jgi:hypothetical protein
VGHTAKMGKQYMHIIFFLETSRERDCLGELGIAGRKILNWISGMKA